MIGETELKPCPFCLRNAIRKRTGEFDRGYFYRVGCGVEFGDKCVLANGGRGYDTQAEADDAWNHRTTPPGLETVPEGTMAVIQSLDDFQVEYKKFTRDNAPGNDYWSGKFLALIGSARAILTRHRATQDGK